MRRGYDLYLPLHPVLSPLLNCPLSWCFGLKQRRFDGYMIHIDMLFNWLLLLLTLFRLQDHGTPVSLSQVTTMTIRVKDADDQNPVFSQDLYTASVSETASITVSFASCLSYHFLYFYHDHDRPLFSSRSLTTWEETVLFSWFFRFLSLFLSLHLVCLYSFCSCKHLLVSLLLFNVSLLPLLLLHLLFFCFILISSLDFLTGIVHFSLSSLSCLFPSCLFFFCDLLFCHAFGRKKHFRKNLAWRPSLHEEGWRRPHCFFGDSSLCCCWCFSVRFILQKTLKKKLCDLSSLDDDHRVLLLHFMPHAVRVSLHSSPSIPPAWNFLWNSFCNRLVFTSAVFLGWRILPDEGRCLCQETVEETGLRSRLDPHSKWFSFIDFQFLPFSSSCLLCRPDSREGTNHYEFRLNQLIVVRKVDLAAYVKTPSTNYLAHGTWIPLAVNTNAIQAVEVSASLYISFNNELVLFISSLDFHRKITRVYCSRSSC